MSGGKSSSSYTTGYRYYAGLQLVFCHAVDKLLGIIVGDEWAWTGEVTENDSIYIDEGDLFGGDDSEGGIVGTVDVCFGESDQERNSYLQSVIGDEIPAYRGLFGIVANQCQLSSNNPYIKEWGVLAQRTTIGWYDELAEIVADDGYVDMNPAHIIYDAITNTEWGGLGYPTSDIDLDSFYDVAYTLADGDDDSQEAFGLSLIWAKDTSIEDFILNILKHIDGVLYFSHVTGLLTLKLIRDDYTVSLLPELNESNVIELVEYSSPSVIESVNQVTINWVDRDNDEQATTVQDIAGITRAGGQVISATVDCPGIATEELAAKVAARELQQVCVPISSCTLTTNRKNWDLEPGDCFVFNWDPIGLSDVVMRVESVEIGEYVDSQLRINAVRDVYGLGNITITEPAESLWTSSLTEATNVSNFKLLEMTWWQFVMLYGESNAVISELDDTSTLLTCVCEEPSSDSLNYQLYTRNSGSSTWTKRDKESFPFVGTTATALEPELTTTIQLQDSSIDTNLVSVGTYAMLGDELVAVTAIDTINVTVTVTRGILDTIPQAHAAGTYIFFHQDYYALDETDRAEGETVEVKILPATSYGRLDIDDATLFTVDLVGRMMLPYPPGNVQVNGQRWAATLAATDELSISWSHRSRTAQTVSFISQDEGDIGPETGTTYTLRIYDGDDVLLRTESGLTDTSYTYATADEQADSNITDSTLNSALRIELESVCGDLTSLNAWDIDITRA